MGVGFFFLLSNGVDPMVAGVVDGCGVISLPIRSETFGLLKGPPFSFSFLSDNISVLIYYFRIRAPELILFSFFFHGILA